MTKDERKSEWILSIIFYTQQKGALPMKRPYTAPVVLNSWKCFVAALVLGLLLSGCRSKDPKKDPGKEDPSPHDPNLNLNTPQMDNPGEGVTLFYEIPCDIKLTGEELEEASRSCKNICTIQKNKGKDLDCETLCSNPNQDHCQVADKPDPEETTTPPADTTPPAAVVVDPVQQFFTTPNPCGTAPGYLCVTRTMNWRVHSPGKDEERFIDFVVNYGKTKPKYKAYVDFYDTRFQKYIRIRIAGTIHREAQRHSNGFRFYLPEQTSNALLRGPVPMVLDVPPTYAYSGASKSHYIRQKYQLKVGIQSHTGRSGRNACSYKIIFIEPTLRKEVGYLSGQATCWR